MTVITAVPSPSTSLNVLVPGGSFRQYQLLEQIGVGGQAVVWSALDRSQNRIYAIKFNKVLDSDQIHAEELGIEGKLEKLVELHHPYVLPLHEYGTEANVRYMVTPYIPGGTLASRMKIAAFSVDDVLRYGAEVALALDYLHGQGVIHRDIKTSNILLDFSQHTYLADFGLARLVSTSTLAFHTGHGTPPYAPPEQVRSKEITPKSDIYSFGILLFEMFTGKLPWNGAKQLGVEQLHSKEELPDLREYVPGLPLLLTDILRRTTSANPVLRPRSASEVMKMVYSVFNVPFESSQGKKEYDELTARSRDADELLREGLAQWKSTNGKFNLGLTRFALIDLYEKRINTDVFNRFMLSQALTYGYHDAQWWAAIKDPRERLLVSSVLLGTENEAIAGRVLKHLTNDSDILASGKGLPEKLTTSLLAIGINTNNATLRQRIFIGIRTLVPPAKAWQDPPLSSDEIKRLGGLALLNSPFGGAAAELVGHIHAPGAVRVILQHSDEGRKLAALQLIQRVAGDLPAFVPGELRLRLSVEWILHRLIQQPANLIGAYMLAFLGAAFGVGLQVYLTYNLPTFLDMARISTAVEQGLIVGAVLGFGIFLARVITERFHTARNLLPILMGTVIGFFGIYFAFLIFHVLFLNTPPSGLLIFLGCMLIALTFAANGLIRWRLIKMLLASISILVAILGTWWLHSMFTASPAELTPLFQYDHAWAFTKILWTALSVAFLIGTFGNLINLSIQDEYS